MNLPERASHNKALLFILLTSFIWGLTFPIAKYLLVQGLTPEILLSIRFSLGSFVLLAWALTQPLQFQRQTYIDGLILGIVLAAIFWFQMHGLQTTTATKSGFITGLYVIFTFILATLLGDKFNRYHVLASLIAFIGLSLLVYNPEVAFGGWTIGDSQTLLSAFLIGAHIVLTSRFTKRTAPLILSLLQCAVVAVVLSGMAYAQTTADQWEILRQLSFQSSFWLPMLYLALIATSLGFWFQCRFQPSLTSTETGIIFSLEPVFGAMLAATGWIPGIQDHLGNVPLFGAVLMFLATLVSQWPTGNASKVH
ncbi:hypothetical protein LBMAG01_04840 [Acidobacteriota bacterium]|nr:hypothetical protein LBMAG01_04840 [Acidobacteriota bacterium]